MVDEAAVPVTSPICTITQAAIRADHDIGIDHDLGHGDWALRKSKNHHASINAVRRDAT
jgi:hypothetical protein